MGGSRWSSDTWTTYSSAKVTGKTIDKVFTGRSLDPSLDPKGVSIRESRDSDINPNSNAIIVGLDVTGSMGSVVDAMMRGLNTLVEEIYSRKPVSDPHIMCMGIGDAEAGDSAPLQITQFEADIKIAEQLQKIWLEGRGGGNNYESYILPWYFAAMNTSIDCFEKRGKKGYLFTVGDEQATPYLNPEDVERVLGVRPQSKIMAEDLLSTVSRTYEVFHIMVKEGSYFRTNGDKAEKSWKNLLGQRAILLKDHKMLSQVIVSAIQANEGVSKTDIVKSWDGTTGIVVGNAIRDISAASGTSGIIEF
jgi:hypothetical protein